MDNENNIDPAEIQKTLRDLGWNGDSTPPAPKQVGDDDDPLTALNMDTHESVNTLPIPEETLQGMAPPEKERVRHLAGGVPDTGETSKKDPWSRDVPVLGKVTVTAEELEQYTRALLFDESLQLEVGVWMGRENFKVGIRSLYVSEKELMACAVAKIAENYPIKTIHNAAVISDYWLKMCVLLQITSVQGKPQERYDARPEPGQLPEASPKVDELAKLARTAFGNTHQAKLKAMIRALHIFETKQQILEDAFHNRDFPLPADAC